jgi:alkylation response protein AidB-like acyl-CoA dehydrogenase
VSAVAGIDAEAGWTRVKGEIGAAGATPVDDAAWCHAIAAGRLALAHESIGVAQAMLSLAVAHATDRHQFGVPIGTFQAVQHRLADVHVQIESARAVARMAWIDANPDVATAALMAARRAVESSTEHCHQVMGAIGCTWEHPLHHFIRRGALLSLLLAIDASGYDTLVAAARSTHRTEVFA